MPEYPTTPLADLTVSEVLGKLGDTSTKSQMADRSVKNVSVEAGESIVKKGYGIKANGQKAGRVSKHFECIACHNTTKEDPDLTISDPEKRLAYAAEHNIPFLQGTTMYGMINRTSFYNGDYEKKYGELVNVARNDIREAIQVCATECSQGRPMKDWEVESVLAYLETIQIKIGDLNLSSEETVSLESALSNNQEAEVAVKLVKSKYLAGSPATFISPPENRTEGNKLTGNPENGKFIYESSCLHCHENKRYSFFNLDNSRSSFRFLKKNINRYTRHSIYQVGRYGTSPLNGKKAYMPQYTEEKMSRQQMEDLRTYIEQRAAK